MNRIEILTIFPEIFSGFLSSSLIAKARERGLLEIKLTNIRDFAPAPHYQTDDTPYGGGAGMVMKPEPLVSAIESAKKRLPNARVVLLTPAGTVFSQSKAIEFSKQKELILICGRYEGIDERVVELCVDEEISIGDYVLMGGEIPAMVVIESSARFIEHVLGNSESSGQESFNAQLETPLLEAPHYTRPPEFRGLKVPEILLSGNHAKVAKWREEQAQARTKERRPDLLRTNSKKA